MKVDTKNYEFSRCSCSQHDNSYEEDSGNIPDEIWCVDFNTNIWLRVFVKNCPSFVRGSGRREPQWFELDSLYVIESTGDPDSIHMEFAEDYFWPANDSELWPSDVPIDHQDVRFPDWLRDHEDEFISFVLGVLWDKTNAFRKAFYCASFLRR